MRDIASTLVDQYNVDVITQQTDSGSPLDVATEKGIWYVGKDMDIVGEYGWSTTDTVAVSFDTRWEVLFDKVLQARFAGEEPETLSFLGMDQTMELADGTVESAVDIMNDPFELSQPIVALAAFADLGIGALYFLAWAAGWGAGSSVAPTYEYGNTFLIVAGLLNLLVMLDVYDVAVGRK